MALSQRLQLTKHLSVALGTISISTMLQLAFFPSLAVSEVASTVDNNSILDQKASLCQNSLSPSSIDKLDYSQVFSVPTSQPVRLASSQINSVFSGFQTATYAKKIIQDSHGGNVVWCRPCPYYPATACWAFAGDCN